MAPLSLGNRCANVTLCIIVECRIHVDRGGGVDCYTGGERSAIEQPDRRILPRLVSTRNPDPERAAALGHAAGDRHASIGRRVPL